MSLLRHAVVGCTLAVIAGGPAGAGAGGPAESETGSDASSVSSVKKPRIVALLFSRDFEFMRGLDHAMRLEAKKLGAELDILEGEFSTDLQARQIEEAVAGGVDAIIISPNDSEEIVPTIKKANGAKVPVVAVDAPVGEGASVATFVGFDNAAGGKMAAEYLIGLGTVSKALDLEGAARHGHADLRGEGFETAAKGHFEVVTGAAEWLSEEAETIALEVLSADARVNAVFAETDAMVPGVLAALRQATRDAKVGEDGHTPIVGIDGTPLALDRIRNGEQDATVNQDPFAMGEMAVRAALAAIRGESLPEEQLLPPTLVTKETVDDPALWGNLFKF